MSKFPRPSGSSTPKPTKPTITITDHYADDFYKDPPEEKKDPMPPTVNLDKEFAEITEIKEKKQRRNKERDLLIECKGLLDQLQDYKALFTAGRTTGPRIKKLLAKIEEVLE